MLQGLSLTKCLEELFGELSAVRKHNGITWELVSLDILSEVKLRWFRIVL